MSISIGMQDRSCSKLCIFGSGTKASKGRNGGDRRDRTDDLKLAKLPLSQLSYVPPEANSPRMTAQAIPRGNDGGPGKI